MKRFLFLLLCLSISTTLYAQSEWSAWLLTMEDGRLTRVDQNGFVEDFILPLPPGFDSYDFDSVYQVNIAPDGIYMAYTARNSQTAARQLLIYHHELKAVVATYDLTGVGADSAATPLFSDDSSELVIGYSLTDGWEILIIDVATFNIVTDLRFDDPQIAQAGIPNTDEMFPSIQWYHDDELAFTLVNSDMSFDFVSVGYIWNTVDGSITPADVDTLYPPTGERVAAVYDASIPSNSQYVKMANTLQAYSPSDGQSYTFYADPGGWLIAPRFVGNGAYVSFLHYKEGEDWQWQIVDREGSLVKVFEPEVTDVEGTADGYLYVRETGSAALYYAPLDGTRVVPEGTLVYDSGDDLSLYIVWVGNFGGFPMFTAQSYAAWGGKTTQDTDNGQVVVAVTPTPDETVLREGVTAIVNTTSGDSLNMRTDAGTAYQIRKKLPRGTEVIVVEGPVEAEGFNWWKVREADGTEGWVVDYADGVLTLVPRALFETESADTEAAANPSMESLLEVGDTAVVTLSLRYDALRLRNGAGLNFRIIALLPPGTRVTVVDGPRVSDNLTWWQIRTSDGSVGWAAEIIGSERALTRDDRVPRATPAPTTAATTTYVPPENLIPPLLVSPLPDTVLTDNPRTVKLTWSPVPGATSYALEIEGCAGSVDACTPLQTFPDLTATTYDLTTTADGLYRWRVIATDGTKTSESEWWSFTFDSD
jgi:uncharacterized protein YgiM (DUF1202 family)